MPRKGKKELDSMREEKKGWENEMRPGKIEESFRGEKKKKQEILETPKKHGRWRGVRKKGRRSIRRIRWNMKSKPFSRKGKED